MGRSARCEGTRSYHDVLELECEGRLHLWVQHALDALFEVARGDDLPVAEPNPGSDLKRKGPVVTRDSWESCRPVRNDEPTCALPLVEMCHEAELSRVEGLKRVVAAHQSRLDRTRIFENDNSEDLRLLRRPRRSGVSRLNEHDREER